uniref:Uncharacterized protein n=1 Tax=Anguilla anguilla TaxID=7936 RepID=A0A0E9RCZ8_ANGAN
MNNFPGDDRKSRAASTTSSGHFCDSSELRQVRAWQMTWESTLCTKMAEMDRSRRRVH